MVGGLRCGIVLVETVRCTDGHEVSMSEGGEHAQRGVERGRFWGIPHVRRYAAPGFRSVGGN